MDQHVASYVNESLLQQAVHRHSASWTSDARNIADYLARQVDDASDREVVGPLLPASGGSGVVLHAGAEVATWGGPTIPEMAFSATKSVASLVAGIAFDRGLLVPQARVHDVLDLKEFGDGFSQGITWQHLLQQTSQWEGVLWGKPTTADAQSYREGTEVHNTPPGAGGLTTTSASTCSPTRSLRCLVSPLKTCSERR